MKNISERSKRRLSLLTRRAALLLVPLLAASSASALGRPIRFERLSTEQGLSQSTVMCVLQDSQGFMWFGTEAGLNRYDGRVVTVYRHDVHDPNSLPSDFVWSLAEDASGDLWVATEGGDSRAGSDRKTNSSAIRSTRWARPARPAASSAPSTWTRAARSGWEPKTRV